MNQDGQALQEAAKTFAILCASLRTLVLKDNVPPELLDVCDAASQDFISALRAGGVDEPYLQEVEKALARLRLALDEN